MTKETVFFVFGAIICGASAIDMIMSTTVQSALTRFVGVLFGAAMMWAIIAQVAA